MIQLGEQFQIDFSPAEPEGAGLGLGFIPFLRYSGEDGNGLTELPDFNSIRSAISENFNNTHLIKMRKKFSRWSSSFSQGSWDAQDPKYLWPTYNLDPPDEEE